MAKQVQGEVLAISLLAVTSNITETVPAGYALDDVAIYETANHAVTGGVRIGTTNGGAEVAVALAVGALSSTRNLVSALATSGPLSRTVATTIYIQAVVAWNSASLDIYIPLKKMAP